MAQCLDHIEKMRILKRPKLVKQSEVISSILYDETIQKRVISTETSLKMIAGSFYIPKDNELKPRGEDSHFICAEENTIGVADGVGGWAKRGVDAGEYARELMTQCVIAVHNEPKGAVDPKRVLHKAYSNTMAKGSSTACIITLRGNILHAANVGDSGFMVIRHGKVIYQLPIQQYRFNHPYQLGSNNDHPCSAQEIEVNVEAGDIIVGGTDGLLDNMFPREIEEIIKKTNKEEAIFDHKAQEIACTIANLALYNSFDRFSDTPFSRAARRAGHSHKGGKIDDITVIVAYITKWY